jgi:hypothetical protein
VSKRSLLKAVPSVFAGAALLFLLASFLLVLVCSTQKSSRNVNIEVHVDVHVDQPEGSITPVWNYFGYERTELHLRAERQEAPG